MDFASTLAVLGWQWYHYILMALLAGLIVFYIWYRRRGG
jgi:hypothetical protein